ncbi:glycosyltransferase family 39 protein [Gallaecimonas kandeliae]|uniref:ArnT family glycosyltransferase n=1 Tax=Gallaecimonas kandeliae TaxID=3029055 RepID=UPI00264996DC|nr:glycosyltransferase family 39 protein [Gallaecimonas kandeliae]WKE66501.1 glycosyltransferase family 39 protein [Gallaecimonas kandeliae]
MRKVFTGPTLAALLGLVLILARLLAFPLLPVDETRYLSVAWEMAQNGNWLVPHLNGAPYPHKPPLMFWLINLAWQLGISSDYLSRLVMPLVGLLNFFLLSALVKAASPQDEATANRAPLVLLTLLPWALFLPLTMFDMTVTLCLLLAVWSMLKSRQDRRWLWLAGLGVGLGMLAKGPVMLLYWLPLTLGYKYWQGEVGNNKRWLADTGLATLLGIAVVLAWAVPAAIHGGEAYAQAIFWRQSAGRVANAFAHTRPWYWYLMMVPLLMLPWTLTRFWKGSFSATPLQRMALWGMLPQLLLFSLVSSKQIHYLLPTLPFLAIWLASKWPQFQAKRQWGQALLLLALTVALAMLPDIAAKQFPAAPLPQWVRALALVPLAFAWLMLRQPKDAVLMLAFPLSMQLLLLAVAPAMHHYYDLSPIAQKVAALQQEGRPLGYLGKYANQFRFLGRGSADLTDLHGADAIRDWAQGHPNGALVVVVRHLSPQVRAVAIASTPYRKRYYVLLPSSQWQLLTDQPEDVDE